MTEQKGNVQRVVLVLPAPLLHDFDALNDLEGYTRTNRLIALLASDIRERQHAQAVKTSLNGDA